MLLYESEDKKLEIRGINLMIRSSSKCVVYNMKGDSHEIFE
jgi:hypothetical protein